MNAATLDRIARLAASAAIDTGVPASRNQWYGVDFTTADEEIVRVLPDDTDVRVLLLTAHGSLIWEARFTEGVPRASIIATITSAVVPS